jgi:CSLREA domain-containing protein
MDFGKSALCAVILLWSSLASQRVEAALTFTVDSKADEPDSDPGDGLCRTAHNACTLRAAITEANRSTSFTQIVLSAETYVLTILPIGSNDENSGDLNLNNKAASDPHMTIIGAGADRTVIDANGIDRVFNIEGLQDVTLEKLTVTNGYLDASDGGAIYNAGNLHLINATISNSHARSGGGIYSVGTVDAIYSSIFSNKAYEDGGGIWAGTLTLTSSTVSSNRAKNGGGLAISELIIQNSTIALNTATDYGAGMLQVDSSGIANIYNTTIVYNFADSNQDSTGGAGGIYASAAQDRFNVYNSIIAANWRTQYGIEDNCLGLVTTHAYNRFGASFGCSITQDSGSYATLSSNNGDYLIGPLQNNGGFTQTVALYAGSNAINAAPTCFDRFSNPITVDQRGFLRNVGACDIGAYEYGAVDPNDAVFADGFQ